MLAGIPWTAKLAAVGWLAFCLAPERVRKWFVRGLDWLTDWPGRLRWVAGLWPREVRK